MACSSEDTLDRMLSDLKTTVSRDGGTSSASVRRGDPPRRVPSFRSSSRERAANTVASFEDAGQMKHSRQEYTSPDQSTHVVTEKFEYDTGDKGQKHIQKKLMKSTYSSYKTMSAGSLEDPPSYGKDSEPVVQLSGTKGPEGQVFVIVLPLKSQVTEIIGQHNIHNLHSNVSPLNSLLSIKVPHSEGSQGSMEIPKDTTRQSHFSRDIKKDSTKSNYSINSNIVTRQTQHNSKHEMSSTDFRKQISEESIPYTFQLNKPQMALRMSSESNTDSIKTRKSTSSDTKVLTNINSLQPELLNKHCDTTKGSQTRTSSIENMSPSDVTINLADFMNPIQSTKGVQTASTSADGEVNVHGRREDRHREAISFLQRRNKTKLPDYLSENSLSNRATQTVNTDDSASQTEQDLSTESNYRHSLTESNYRQSFNESNYRHSLTESNYRHSLTESNYRQSFNESTQTMQELPLESVEVYTRQTRETSTGSQTSEHPTETKAKTIFRDAGTGTQTDEDDYATLTRLHKRISELDTMIKSLDDIESEPVVQSQRKPNANLNAPPSVAKSITKTPTPIPLDRQRMRDLEDLIETLDKNDKITLTRKMPSPIFITTPNKRTLSSPDSASNSGIPLKSANIPSSSRTSSALFTHSIVPSDNNTHMEDHSRTSTPSRTTSMASLLPVILEQATPRNSLIIDTESSEVQPSSPTMNDRRAALSGQNRTYQQSSHTTTKLTNGHRLDDDDDFSDDQKSADVRRIVWRNRYEKTYDARDSNHHDGHPTLTIEEESRRRNMKEVQDRYDSFSANVSRQPTPKIAATPRLQYAVYWPGSGANVPTEPDTWVDPIPLATPPKLSPREPGVAYIYTYGQPGESGVQSIPPLNYMSLPGTSSVQTSEGAPSPTPSGQQPIIYHYSYHYNLAPGQSIPDGAPGHPHTHQPSALQLSHHPDKNSTSQPPSSTSNYNYNLFSSNSVNRTESTTTNKFPGFPGSDYTPQPTNQKRLGYQPDPNVSISVNKKTTHTTHTFEDQDGHRSYRGPKFLDKEPPPYGSIGRQWHKSETPLTSTPYPERERSISPDRSPLEYGSHVSRASYTDSLERVRRPKNEGLPFPDTSPIRPAGEGKIPRKVDDLMNSFSDTEDGPVRTQDGQVRSQSTPARKEKKERVRIDETRSQSTPKGKEVSQLETEAEILQLNSSTPKRTLSKPQAGPAVYYPPGHELFHETMHTMSLKESGRRGKAKWRHEKSSGAKSSSSSSESKGGVAMVPVCLPLCCGAACVIM